MKAGSKRKHCDEAREAFYAVKFGSRPGIYRKWEECKEQIAGVKGAVYRKFTDKDEAIRFVYDERFERIKTTVDLDSKPTSSGLAKREEISMSYWPMSISVWLGIRIRDDGLANMAFIWDKPDTPHLTVVYDWSKPANETRCCISAISKLCVQLRKHHESSDGKMINVFVFLRSKYMCDVINKNLDIWRKKGFMNCNIRDGDSELYHLLHRQLVTTSRFAKIIACHSPSDHPDDDRYVTAQSREAHRIAHEHCEKRTCPSQ